MTLASIIRNHMGADEYRVLNLPRAAVYDATGVAVGTGGTGSALSWSTMVYDTDGMWDAGSPTRLTAHTTGLYLYTHVVRWSLGNGSGDRRSFFVKNGATVYPHDFVIDNFQAGLSTQGAWPIDMSAGDYVEVYWLQTSGIALSQQAATLANRINGFTATFQSTL